MNWDWTDAWLLTSIYLTSKKEPANVKQIIMAGDWINHAIFLDTEINNSLRKLLSIDYVEFQNNHFSVTKKFQADYDKKKKRTKYILDEVDKVLDILRTNSFDLIIVTEYPEVLISKEIIEDAIIQYQNEFGMKKK